MMTYLRDIPSWLAAAVAIALLSGCSFGQPAGSRQIDLFDLPGPLEARLPALPASGIPRPAIALACRSNKPALAAIRPGVGARLDLALWSSGIMPDKVKGNGNAGPPQVDATPLSLRMVSPGAQLDGAEQRLLGTFLITNRGSWHEPGTGTSTERERRDLAAAIREHQALLWNALAGSLCVEVWENAPLDEPTAAAGRGRTLAVVADMAGVCRALPPASRPAFAKAYLDAAAPSCEGEVYKGLAGLIDGPARSDWTAGAVDVGTHGSASARYYASGAQASIIVTGGALVLDSVRPDRHDAPDWSLAAWEASGICRLADDAPTQIRRLRLRGGALGIDVLDADPDTTTHRIEQTGVSARLKEQRGNWPFASIPRKDLARLRVADVTQLEWAAASSNASLSAQPAGCVNLP